MEITKETPRKNNVEADERHEETRNISDSWFIEVKERFESGIDKYRPSSEGVCIFRVPQSLRHFNPEAYDPQVVSFGPFRPSQVLSGMDDCKLEAVRRRHPGIEIIKLENMDILKQVKGLENEIRDCYQDRAIDWGKEAFAGMITMDACFILEFFNAETEEFNLIFGVKNDYTIMKSEILRDILKLENQLPLFVLMEILQNPGSQPAATNFAKELCVYEMFRGFPFNNISKDEEDDGKKIEDLISQPEKDNGKPPFHLLDVCRMVIEQFLLPPQDEDDNQDGEHFLFPRQDEGDDNQDGEHFLLPPQDEHDDSQDRKQIFDVNAERLAKAGIYLQQSEDGQIRFKKTGFVSFKLCLPQIIVDDCTETCLRNLMALEECRRCSEAQPRKSLSRRKISYYVSVLNKLIKSKEDVALLKDGEIIKSSLNDEKIAIMFHALCSGILEENYPKYDEVLERVMKHNEKWLPRLTAAFKENCWSNPWLSVSFVIAVLIFFMTFAQTVLAFIQTV